MKARLLLHGLVAAILIISCVATASAETVVARILHLTSGAVYLDKGAADGLAEGVRLTALRGDAVIGSLRTDHVSRHSASAQLARGLDLQVGDALRYERESASGADTGGVGLDLRGRAALEYRMFADAGDTGEDFSQPALRLNLSADDLRGLPLDFRLRMRSRYDQRSRELDEERPETEWLHRVYEASLVYDDPEQIFRVAAGRLYDNGFRGAGNWDGGQLELRAPRRWRLGVFAGAGVGLTDSATDFDALRSGAYAGYARGELGETRYEGDLAYVSSIVDEAIDREFLSFENRLWLSRDLSLHQSLELDFNRDWREEASGESSTLSRFNAYVRYRPTRMLSLGLGYDLFQRVRDAATRALPDSLFPDYEQAGLRASAALTLPSGVGLGGSLGLRSREDEPDKDPLYLNAWLSATNVRGNGTDLQFRYAYADGRFAKSHVPSLDVQQAVTPELRLGAGFGAQSYEGLTPETFSLDGQWLRLYGSYRLTRSSDLQLRWRHATGDIGEGDEIYLSLGHRF